MDRKENTRYYILNPGYAFRGWKLLPYAAQYLHAPQTEFFNKEQWQLFSACDGQTEIDWDALSGEQKGLYDHWEQNGFIRRCGTDERLQPW